MRLLDKLLAEVCVGVDAAEARAAILETGCLTVDDVPVTLMPAGEPDPDGLHAYCELGELPPGEAGSAALMRLLEFNLHLFRQGAPSFGMDAERGVILMARFDSRELTAPRLLEGLTELAGMARAWQETQFADASMPLDLGLLPTGVVRAEATDGRMM